MSFTRKHPDRRSAALVLLACGGLITACSSMAQDHSSRSTAQAASSPTTVTTITNPGNGTNRITVSGNRGQVRQIEYLQADGDRSLLAIEPVTTP